MVWKKTLLFFVAIPLGLVFLFSFGNTPEASAQISCYADCMNDIDNDPICRAECSTMSCWSNNSCPDGYSCERGSCVDRRPFDPERDGEGLVPCGRADQRPCEFMDLFRLISRILEFAIFVVAPILVGLLIAIGAFVMLLTSANPEKNRKGKEIMKYAIIGLLIILLSFVILYTVLTLIGVDQETGILEWYR